MQFKLQKLIFCFFLSAQLCAQDKIYLTNGEIINGLVKEINPEHIKYKLNSGKDTNDHSLKRSNVAVIEYLNGLHDTLNEPIGFGKNNPYRIGKNAYRYYFTDILYYSKLSFGYERVLSKKLSFEADGFYKFIPSGAGHNSFRWEDAIYHSSEGAEIRTGLSRHYYTQIGRSSYGVSLSYRQQSFSNVTVEENRIGHVDNGVYNLSQKKKGLGLLLKYNYCFNSRRSDFEFFIIGGPYLCYTKNKYQWYRSWSGSQSTIYDTEAIPKLKSWYLKDGLALIPYFNFGLNYKICQPPKGWYKEIRKQRDSLNFRKKNVILYNPIELFDGSVGFTYARVYYKEAFSIFTSLSLGLKNSSSVFSNGLLTERSYNYQLNHKKYDYSISANYNFVKKQKSFPFLGVIYRNAQFTGAYERESFLLNKHYLYLNTGVLARSKGGMSFLFNVNLGKYYNQYVSGNPQNKMQLYNFYGRSNTGISFNFSLQFGYSF